MWAVWVHDVACMWRRDEGSVMVITCKRVWTLDDMHVTAEYACAASRPIGMLCEMAGCMAAKAPQQAHTLHKQQSIRLVVLKPYLQDGDE